MRGIKFRGKSVDDSVWVYGYYVFSRGKHYILQKFDSNGYDERWEAADWIEVNPTTVGQFTNVLDKNGKEIYEGDIINTSSDKMMLVSWNKEFASFCLDKKGWLYSHWFGESCNPEECEVMGNIYENPELLSKREE